MDHGEYPELEWVDPQELAEAEKHNQAFLRAQYEGQVADFRAEIIQRMLGHNAVHDQVGWLLYQETSPTASSVLVDNSPKETLIMMLFPNTDKGDQDNGLVYPHIKVITNTEFRLDEARAFLTEEVTIDQQGDTQLLVDSIVFSDEGDVMPGIVEHVASQAPLFCVIGLSRLITINMQMYTPLFVVTEPLEGFSDSMGKATPFGRYSSLEDKIAALEWAIKIVADTDAAELVNHNSPEED